MRFLGRFKPKADVPVAPSPLVPTIEESARLGGEALALESVVQTQDNLPDSPVKRLWVGGYAALFSIVPQFSLWWRPTVGGCIAAAALVGLLTVAGVSGRDRKLSIAAASLS